MSEHPRRNRIGVSGAHVPPELTALLVHDADRCRLLRYVRSDIARHSNLRWCKPPHDNRPDRGTISGSPRFRDYPRSIDIVGRFGDPVLASDIGSLRRCLLLPQHPDDLLFCKPRLPHPPSPRWTELMLVTMPALDDYLGFAQRVKIPRICEDSARLI